MGLCKKLRLNLGNNYLFFDHRCAGGPDYYYVIVLFHEVRFGACRIQTCCRSQGRLRIIYTLRAN